MDLRQFAMRCLLMFLLGFPVRVAFAEESIVARYGDLMRKEQSDSPGSNLWPRVCAREPSEAEKLLLVELRSSDLLDRVDAVRSLVDAELASASVLPVEFLVHAAVGCDSGLRRQVIDAVLKPRFVSEGASEVLLRIGMELAAFKEVPGLSLAMAEYLTGEPAENVRRTLWPEQGSIPAFQRRGDIQIDRLLADGKLSVEDYIAVHTWRSACFSVVQGASGRELSDVTEVMLQFFPTFERRCRLQIALPSRKIADGIMGLDNAALLKNLPDIKKCYQGSVFHAVDERVLKRIYQLDEEREFLKSYEAVPLRLQRLGGAFSMKWQYREFRLSKEEVDEQVVWIRRQLANVTDVSSESTVRSLSIRSEVLPHLTEDEKHKIAASEVRLLKGVPDLRQLQSSAIRIERVAKFLSDEEFGNLCSAYIGFFNRRQNSRDSDAADVAIAGVFAELKVQHARIAVLELLKLYDRNKNRSRPSFPEQAWMAACERLGPSEAEELVPVIERIFDQEGGEFVEALVIAANQLGPEERIRILNKVMAVFTRAIADANNAGSAKASGSVWKACTTARAIGISEALDSQMAITIAEQLLDALCREGAPLTLFTGQQASGAFSSLAVAMDPVVRAAFASKFVRELDDAPKELLFLGLGRALKTLLADAGAQPSAEAFAVLMRINKKYPDGHGILEFIQSRPRVEAGELAKVLGVSVFESDSPGGIDADVGSVATVVGRVRPKDAGDALGYLLDHLPSEGQLDEKADELLLTGLASLVLPAEQPQFGRKILGLLNEPRPFNSEFPLLKCLGRMQASLNQEQCKTLLQQQISRLLNPPKQPPQGRATLAYGVSGRVATLAPLIKRLPEDDANVILDKLVDSLDRVGDPGIATRLNLAWAKMFAQAGHKLSEKNSELLLRHLFGAYRKFGTREKENGRQELLALIIKQGGLPPELWSEVEPSLANEICDYYRFTARPFSRRVAPVVFEQLWQHFLSAPGQVGARALGLMPWVAAEIEPSRANMYLSNAIQYWGDAKGETRKRGGWRATLALTSPFARQGKGAFLQVTQSLQARLTDRQKRELELVLVEHAPIEDSRAAVDAIVNTGDLRDPAFLRGVLPAVRLTTVLERMRFVDRSLVELGLDKAFLVSVHVGSSAGRHDEFESLRKVLADPRRVGAARILALTTASTQLQAGGLRNGYAVAVTHWESQQLKDSN